jgi:hypothetical protein
MPQPYEFDLLHADGIRHADLDAVVRVLNELIYECQRGPLPIWPDEARMPFVAVASNQDEAKEKAGDCLSVEHGLLHGTRPSVCTADSSGINPVSRPLHAALGRTRRLPDPYYLYLV